MRPSTFVASLLVLFTLQAQAATYTVTRFDDPAPGACVPAACSLREAMQAAADNGAAGGTDTVVLSVGTYALTRGVLPPVDGQGLHLQGAGSGQTRITMGEVPNTAYLLNVRANGNLRVTGLSLSAEGEVGVYSLAVFNATLFAEDIVTESGRVYNATGSNATLRNVELRREFSNYSTALIEDSTLVIAVNGATTNPSQLTLRRVLVDGALLAQFPGASYVGAQGGLTIIEDSTITRSQVTITSGAATLRRVHYIDNFSSVRGSGAGVVIEDSLFENNTDRALYVGGTNWTVSGSTFRNNRSDQTVGGAVRVEFGAAVDIRNSTFSGNTFSVDAPAGARGAAIGFAGDAQVTLRHVTIVPPTVMPVGSSGSAIGGTGSTARIEVYNSIVRGTCALEAGVLQGVSRGNIESPGNTCALNAATNQVSVTNAALALGPLADHGGPTPTYSLNAGSVAIDNGHVLYYLPTDQRGYLRSGASTSDIGAFERDGIDRIFKNGFEG